MQKLFHLFLLAAAFSSEANIFAVEIAKSGKSAFVIYYDIQAPKSVKRAAEEIQHVIFEAAGVKLSIVHEPHESMISLGDTPSARKVGIDASKFADENFVIVVKQDSLFLVGKDTRDDERTWGASDARGESKGSLWAAYEFLERLTDVHWLMPGEMGEEIPKSDHLVWKDIEIHKAPAFPSRLLSYVHETAPGRKGYPDVDLWLERMRSGGSLSINAAHSWMGYITPEMLANRPEFAAVGGDGDKLNTNNPELIKVFAAAVIETIRKRPNNRSYSISPSDGGGFSQDPQTLAHVEKDPHGDTSYTRVILEFYNAVARIVAKEYPDKFLTGLVYYNYMYPPAAPMKIEPNVHLQWAALEYYGFGLYKPKYQKEFETVSKQWGKVAQGRFSYQSYSHYMRSLNGAPVPPGFDILKMELPIMKRVIGAEGVYMIGNAAWGTGALLNYLLARQMWDPDFDVDAASKEWLKLAYGPGWQSMENIYRSLDAAFKKHKQTEAVKRNYDVNYEVVRSVYLPLLDQIESDYETAWKATTTEKQRQRMEAFANNLREFNYYLRKAGLITNPEKSRFYLSDENYAKFWKEALQGYTVNSVAKPIWIPENRTLSVPQIADKDSPPQIDANADDPAWKQAAIADHFRITGSVRSPMYATVAKVISDGKFLYILFECAIPQDMLTAASLSKDDGRIYNSSNVGVYLADSSALDQWWHFTVDTVNNQWDGLRDNPQENREWKSASKIADGKWIVEMQIPLSTFSPSVGAEKSKRELRVNVARQQRLSSKIEEAPPTENSTWNSVEEHFAQPEQFGIWTLEKIK